MSLTKIIDALLRLCDWRMILLYKPQFEVGPEHINRRWLPKNNTIITEKFQAFLCLLRDKNMRIIKTEKSSLKGEAGNQEWLIACEKLIFTEKSLKCKEEHNALQ